MTQHPQTPPPDPMPLDPEERALAARLARLGPHGEPSSALDARVLAAAHAAMSGGARAAAPGRGREHGWRRARWPVGVGVAASVVLAAGIAWQMRPLPAPVVPVVAVAGTAVAVSASDSVAASAPAAAAPSEMRVFAPAAPAEDATAGVAASETAATTAPAAARAGALKSLAPPPPEEPAVVFDEPNAVDVQAPPPAPPAPPAPVAAQAVPPPAAAVPTQQAGARAKSAAQVQAQEAPPVSEAVAADAPEVDVPPATAASPEVRDAWLARIRELAADGRGDEARASLAEFRRRYPAFAIPDDLRPLLPPPPQQ